MSAIVRSQPPADRLAAFHRIEQGFAPQARIWVLLAGASGLWLTWRADLWWRFADPSFWWMHAMVLLWCVFAMMLFVIEPLFVHRRMARSPSPETDFQRMITVHRVLSFIALATIAGATAGAHGWLL